MSPSVLVVEDYADLRSAIAHALTRRHYQCEPVSRAQAIEKLRENHYGTILLAPTLPISGDPVVHFILEEQPDQACNVVLMTSPSVGVEGSAEDYRTLVKPFNTDQLFAKIK